MYHQIKTPTFRGYLYLVELVGTGFIFSLGNILLQSKMLVRTSIVTSNSRWLFSPSRAVPDQFSTKENTPSFDEALYLVELVGTAPTSASLSWLVFYRHSLF